MVMGMDVDMGFLGLIEVVVGHVTLTLIGSTIILVTLNTLGVLAVVLVVAAGRTSVEGLEEGRLIGMKAEGAWPVPHRWKGHVAPPRREVRRPGVVVVVAAEAGRNTTSR